MQQGLCRHTHTGIQGQQPLALGSRTTARKRGQYRGQRLHRGRGMKRQGRGERRDVREKECGQAQWAGLFERDGEREKQTVMVNCHFG